MADNAKKLAALEYYRHLIELSRQNRLAELREEIATHPNVNSVEEGLEDLLNLAIELGDVPLVQAMIECGAPVFQPDDQFDGYPPLVLAIMSERRDAAIVELLLKQGAQPNQIVGGGETPLHLAVSYNHVPIIEVLLRYNADPTLEDIDTYFTPLMLAVSSCHQDAVKSLLKAGVRPDYQNSQGQTAYQVVDKKCPGILDVWRKR